MRKLILALSALAMTAGVAPSMAQAQYYSQSYSYGQNQTARAIAQRCAVQDRYGRVLRDARCERRLTRQLNRQYQHQPYGNAYGYYGTQPAYGYDRYERVDRSRVYYGNDGRAMCRRSDGTVGILVGAGGGALIGRSIDTRGERTTGTVLGAVIGGLLGSQIDRGEARCARR